MSSGSDYYRSRLSVDYSQATEEEIVALVRRAKRRDKQAVERLVAIFLPLIRKAAYSSIRRATRAGTSEDWFRNLDVDDLVNDGILALYRAVDGFDEDKNVRFITYFYRSVHSFVFDAIFDTQRLIRIPRSSLARSQQLPLGHCLYQPVLSSDYRSSSDDQTRRMLLEIQDRTQQDVSYRLDAEMMKEQLRDLLQKCLSSRDAKIVSMNMRGDSTVAIAKKMGLSKQGVQLILKRSLNKLRQAAMQDRPLHEAADDLFLSGGKLG